MLTQSSKLDDLIANVIGKPEVDSAADAVDFEAGAQARMAKKLRLRM